MNQPDRHTHLPSTDRMSLLTATILLMLAISHFIDLPESTFSLQLPGFYLGLPLGVPQVVALIVAIMAASGADWLLRGHPHLGDHTLLEHWLLPGFTALAIGLPLLQMPISPVWWLAFFLGGTLLILVLIAEYISVDTQDLRQPAAASGLTAVAFALFLVLVATLRFTTPRLSLILPLLALSAFLVSLRILRLWHPEEWFFMEAGLVALITVMIAAPLHYWPLTPVSFGLALLGPSYSLTNFFGALADNEPVRKALVEPLVILALIWIAAAVFQ